MSFFQKIEGEGAVVVEKGIYRQVELYERDGLIYVKIGGGFIRVMADGSTSKLHGNLKLDFMSWSGPQLAEVPGRGYLCTVATVGARALKTDNQQRLLGGSVAPA